MRKGTKIGWLLIALSIVLSVWVIVSQSSRATDDSDFTVDGSTLVSYNGADSTVDSIPAGVTTIGSHAFAAKTGLTSVNLANGNSLTMQGQVFSGDTHLSSVNLGNATSIPEGTFNSCSALQTLTIPGSVTSIGANAFSGSGITALSLPASVNSVSASSFDGANNLTTINAGGSFSSSGGCLYSGGTARLIRVPVAHGAVTIPGSCTEIGAGAFKGCNGVTTLDLPSGVSTIAGGAFTGSNVKSLTVRNKNASMTGCGLSPDATIYGYSGSTAAAFADANGNEFIALDGGDDPDPGPTPGPTPDPGDDRPAGGAANVIPPSSVDDSGRSTPVVTDNEDPMQNPAPVNPRNPDNTDPGNGNNQNPSNPDPNAPGNQDQANNTDPNAVAPGPGGNDAGSGSNGAGSNSAGSGSNGAGSGSGGSAAHTADVTPKTADGDLDPRFIISFAVLAVGVAAILAGRKKTVVSKSNRGNLDD